MPKVKEILQKVPFLKLIGNDQTEINQLIQLSPDNNRSDVLMWASEKNIEILSRVKAGVIICPESTTTFHPSCQYIVTKNPRLTFQKTLEEFFMRNPIPGISKKASIHPTVKPGRDIFIGDHVVIEEGCKIGNFVTIDHNTVIKSGSILFDNVKIGSNCTIGGVGFGYEKDENGNYQVIPHIGNVILKERVEIGNNTCIDRAVLGSTILEENVKVDNLVHIAHGVTIGKNSLIIANTMIGGSTHIGENVWVAPSTSILNKKNVKSNSVLGMGAVIVKDVAEGETIIGNPGKPLIKEKR
jgi:UDP-3-O-[3-hydroxymyristoyl] glucosamine N-acyltransferase